MKGHSFCGSNVKEKNQQWHLMKDGSAVSITTSQSLNQVPTPQWKPCGSDPGLLHGGQWSYSYSIELQSSKSWTQEGDTNKLTGSADFSDPGGPGGSGILQRPGVSAQFDWVVVDGSQRVLVLSEPTTSDSLYLLLVSGPPTDPDSGYWG